jgi:hypothetical protein
MKPTIPAAARKLGLVVLVVVKPPLLSQSTTHLPTNGRRITGTDPEGTVHGNSLVRLRGVLWITDAKSIIKGRAKAPTPCYSSAARIIRTGKNVRICI